MSVINTPDFKIFAQEAKNGEIVDFPNLLRGWGVTLDQTAGKPPMEWFNALQKRTDEWLMYLSQRGLPEWQDALDYPKDAVVQFDGKFYVAKRESKNAQPDRSQNDWGAFFPSDSGRLLNIKTFSSSGTYIPTPGTKKVHVKVWGGGGGGGNTDVAGAGGPSGSGGGYAEGIFEVQTSSVSVTVGTGGAEVAANIAAAGGNGGESSFGSLIICGGGNGGTVASNAIPGGKAQGGNVMNSSGQGGQGGVAGLGGTGGGSFGSFGGLPHNSSNGDDGGFPGGGGAGGTNASSTRYFASGKGAAGYVIVTEYA